jgi:REP element-mobilizing transposase RayT
MNLEKMGWRSREYIPHLNGWGEHQSITLRLYDALPRSVAMLLQAKALELPEPEQVEAAHDEAQQWLDAGYGSCILKEAQVATVVENALLHFHRERYQVMEWCVMPNHLHALLYITPPFTLSSIIHSFKSYSAKEANRVLGRRGPFWFPEYFDRYIRSENHFKIASHYIRENPVKARLCTSAEQWRFSSAWEGRGLVVNNSRD